MCSELQVLCMEAHQALQGRRQQNVDAQDLSAAREALASGVGGSESSDQRIRALAVLSAIQRMLAVSYFDPLVGLWLIRRVCKGCGG